MSRRLLAGSVEKIAQLKIIAEGWGMNERHLPWAAPSLLFSYTLPSLTPIPALTASTQLLYLDRHLCYTCSNKTLLVLLSASVYSGFRGGRKFDKENMSEISAMCGAYQGEPLVLLCDLLHVPFPKRDPQTMQWPLLACLGQPTAKLVRLVDSILAITIQDLQCQFLPHWQCHAV